MKARENKASINHDFREADQLSHAFTRQKQAFFLRQRHKIGNSRAKSAENANKLSATTAKSFQ